MSSATKKPETLIIADQERLHGIFDLSGVQCVKAFTLAEGLKAAQKLPPALLFIQSRLGGLSGEILARHIRLELKDKKTRLVLLCNPEDMPAPGNKTFAATVDISPADEQLAEQVHSLVNSLLAGKSLRPVRGKKSQAERPHPNMNGKPVYTVHDGGRDHTAGQERRESSVEVPRPAIEPAPEQPEPAVEVADIVEISNRDIAPAGPEEMNPSSAENPQPAARFREELESALGKTIAEGLGEKTVEPGATTAAADTQVQPLRTILSEQTPPGKIKSRPRASGRIMVLSLSVVLLGIFLLWQFSGTRSAPKTAETALQTRTGKTATERQILPAGQHPGNTVGKPDASGTKTKPPAAEERKPVAQSPAAAEVKYLKYTVRPGDTVYSILTKRFGLSSRMAESLIPQVLEKNRLSRNAVLSVGREILIPEDVRIQPPQGVE